MIVAKQKDFQAIKRMVGEARRVLVVGCKTCVTVCNAGGMKEVGVLAATLKLDAQREGRPLEVSELTLERQCDPEYVAPLAAQAEPYDLVVSMGCGAGVQLVAEHVARPVLPALDTMFIGVTESAGTWTERCQACGDCKLGLTGGICPVARCSKSLMNGPCGGSNHGKCEISGDVLCGWHLIVERLEALGQLDRYEEILEATDWSTSRDGGPRKVHREDLA